MKTHQRQYGKRSSKEYILKICARKFSIKIICYCRIQYKLTNSVRIICSQMTILSLSELSLEFVVQYREGPDICLRRERINSESHSA